jgi:cephalosporin hydroxylase
MDALTEFKNQVENNIKSLRADRALADLSLQWVESSLRHRFSYNFRFLGQPIIQYPADMVAVQELIWEIRPDLIIETGIAHGGSLMLSASMLALLDYADAVTSGELLDPKKPKRRVLGVDIEIRPHNREAIETHPLSGRIEMIEGSSIADEVVRKVQGIASGCNRIMVCLDSNHTHDHVLAELNAYAPLVSPGSYCIVFDTIVDDLPKSHFPDRPWGPGDNPKTAVRAFLADHPEFTIDHELDAKLQITVAPDGYLRRTTYD